MIEVIVALLFVTGTVVSASWQDRPSPQPLCSSCLTHPQDYSNHRGFGADNLNYDWSPKAWGGPAFPNNGDERRGRSMGEQHNHCGGCVKQNAKQETDADLVAMVTSPVLGVRLRDDRREAVEWSGRSMRWDGFRNGMAWDRMERRDGQHLREETPRTASGKEHYAADWKYQSHNGGGYHNEFTEKSLPNNGWHRDGQRDELPNKYYQTSTQRPLIDDGWPGGQSNQYLYDRPQYGHSSSYPHGQKFESQLSSHALQYPSQSSRPPPEIYVHTHSYGPQKQPAPEYPIKPHYGASPGMAIWNNDRPSSPQVSIGHRNPSYFTGIITEISSPINENSFQGAYGATHANNNYLNYDTTHTRPQGTHDENDGYAPNRRPHNTYGPNKYYEYPKGLTNTGPYLKNNHVYENYPTSRPTIDRNPYNNDSHFGKQPLNGNFGREPYNQQGNFMAHRYPYDDNLNNRPNGYSFKERNPTIYLGTSNSETTNFSTGPNSNSNAGSWNYGEGVPYRRSGGSYPSYKGGNYFTSSYLASASTSPSVSHSSAETTQPTTGDH